MAQRIKRLPAKQETRVRSLGWEDPLEKEMVTHSSILAWRIPWAEEPGRLQSTGSQKVRHDWETSHTHTIYRHSVQLMCSVMSDSATVAHQAPLSMGFSRREFRMEHVTISSSRGSSWPRNQTHIFFASCIGRQILHHCATWEANNLYIIYN